MTTPALVLSSVRSQLYEPTPGFWTDPELYAYMDQAQLDIALQFKCTQSQTAITTVTAQSMYTRPDNVLYIDRLTWDQVKLKKIDYTDYDALQRVAYGGMYTIGRAMHYYEYDDLLGLWPIPSYSAPINIWFAKAPTAITTASTTFDVPIYFHNLIQDYVLYRSFAKDQEDGRASFYKNQYDQGIIRAYTFWRQKQDDDFYRVVKEEDSYRNVELGMI